MELNEKGLPFFPELRFEDKRHIYTLGGQILPSVTTVMKPLDEAYGELGKQAMHHD